MSRRRRLPDPWRPAATRPEFPHHIYDTHPPGECECCARREQRGIFFQSTPAKAASQPAAQPAGQRALLADLARWWRSFAGRAPRLRSSVDPRESLETPRSSTTSTLAASSRSSSRVFVDAGP